MKNTEQLRLYFSDGISRLWRTQQQNNFVREFYQDTNPEEEEALPLRVNFIHEEHCYENYYRQREHSEVFSIELVLEGSMMFEQEEKAIPRHAGRSISGPARPPQRIRHRAGKPLSSSGPAPSKAMR